MAPAPRDSHARLAFLSMAATSARSLKQHVPYARCVLILGFQTPQGEPYASSTTPHRGRTGDRASAASPSAASAPAASSSAMQASERTWPNRTEATRPASWTDALSEDEAKQLESFDRIVRWADAPFTALSYIHSPSPSYSQPVQCTASFHTLFLFTSPRVPALSFTGGPTPASSH